MAAQKLNLPGSVVLNPDKVCEDKFALQCIGLPVHEHRPDRNANSLCDCCVGHHMPSTVRYLQRDSTSSNQQLHYSEFDIRYFLGEYRIKNIEHRFTKDSLKNASAKT